MPPSYQLSVPPAASNLLAFSSRGMEELVRSLGLPRYRARQILRWLYQSRVRDIQSMTDLSKQERTVLSGCTAIRRLESTGVLTSEDGTKKFLFRLQDGRSVESVLIPDEGRLTLCVSTQIGCTLDCSFCLTGTMGLHRNLKPHEIVDQVLSVQDHLDTRETLTNLVFMGMGEPLANVEAVSEAIDRLTNRTWGLGFSSRRITVSTAGLAPRLKEMASLGVNLAVSLNATTDEQRDRLMPAVNRIYPLRELMAACRDYPLPPRRRLTFEYVLLAGLNDSRDDAKRLAILIRGIRCKVNLIPFNEFPGSEFKRPSEETVLAFQSVLKQAGFEVFVRKSKGRDVLGACGQLGRSAAASEALALTPVQAR
ncbi:MAG: dual-specificity RNA methyltransferase RlmN [Nitrospiraceae bacterium]|nr:MAG: dual-specificity RNA methyltransferase RlmN [Nitrospiraceae bacterium]